MDRIDLIDKLLGAADVPVTGGETIKRLGVTFELRAINNAEMSKLRRQNSYEVKTRTGPQHKVNQERLINEVIVAATTNFNWNDERLLKKYQLSDGAEVVNRLLLPGEVAKLGEKVFMLSGFGDEDERVEEVKN